MNRLNPSAILLLFFGLLPFSAFAQYRADFDEAYRGFEPNHLPGWTAVTGQGDLIFRQRTENGSAGLVVDPLREKRNIWYAFVQQDVSAQLDLEQLSQPGYELRMEARVMASHAPRRINLYLSAEDGTGYLREFDLASADEWHTISMVTNGFVFDSSNPLRAQISLMNWGNTDIYELKVDYVTVDVVKADGAHESFGEPIAYQPALKQADHYQQTMAPTASATIDAAFPDEVLSSWQNFSSAGQPSVIQVDQSKTILLQWDFSEFAGKTATEAGQLELATESLFRRDSEEKYFGDIRFSEIMGSVADWDETTVTYNSFLGGENYDDVIVSQCIVDTKVAPSSQSKTIITISRPVMQRLLNGESAGIAIKPLGLISAAFYDRHHQTAAPRLRFNVE